MKNDENTTIEESQKAVQLPVSLRDYFAAKASDDVAAHFVMQYREVVATNEPEKWTQPSYSKWHCEQLAMIEARYRYAFADAMLAARKETK